MSMKITTKVILYSLLIFPGIGHFILKKYALGLVFSLSFAYLLFGLVNQIIGQAQQIAQSITRGEIPLEITAINEALAQQAISSDSSQVFAGYLLLIIWGLSAFDAFRIANKSKPK